VWGRVRRVVSALADRKRRAQQLIGARRDELLEVSHAIHARPELGFEEHFAHELLCRALERAGFDVERGTLGLETAFRARFGSGGLRVAVICEYDALRGLGHACGHNWIAAAGLGAGLALAELCEEAGGQLVVIGTPAEEGGLGGKVVLVERGAFNDVDAALMVHPADVDAPMIPTLACQRLEVTYRGHSVHAAVIPERGKNALDAAVLGYLGVATLRQHIADDERVHGIFTAAGEQTNIVSDRAATEWMVRAPDLARLDELRPRVLAALEAGAQATGCQVEHRCDPAYAELNTNWTMADLYAANATALGRPPLSAEAMAEFGRGSTDMGNVSQAVPSIHPLVRIAPAGVGLHTAEFERCAASDDADDAILDAAAAMAMTVLDLWADPGLIEAPQIERDGRPT
jgi:amidohydrolase